MLLMQSIALLVTQVNCYKLHSSVHLCYVFCVHMSVVLVLVLVALSRGAPANVLGGTQHQLSIA